MHNDKYKQRSEPASYDVYMMLCGVALPALFILLALSRQKNLLLIHFMYGTVNSAVLF